MLHTGILAYYLIRIRYFGLPHSMGQIIRFHFQVQTPSKPTAGSLIVGSWRADTISSTSLLLILSPELTLHCNKVRLALLCLLYRWETEAQSGKCICLKIYNSWATKPGLESTERLSSIVSSRSQSKKHTEFSLLGLVCFPSKSQGHSMPGPRSSPSLIPSTEPRFTIKWAPGKHLLNGALTWTFWKLGSFWPSSCSPSSPTPSGDWNKGCFQDAWHGLFI